MNRSSTFIMDGHLLNNWVDQTIVVEVHLSCQSGEFYFAIFGDFNLAIDSAWQVLGLVAAQLDRPVRSHLEIEQWVDAATCYGRSLDAFQGGDFQRDRAITLWRWAQYKLGLGNAEQGQAMWQEAREIFYRLNIPLMVARMEQGVG